MHIEELNNLYYTFYNLQTPLAYRQFIQKIKQLKSEGYRFVLQKNAGSNHRHQRDAERLAQQLEFIRTEKDNALRGENYEKAAKCRDEELRIQNQLQNPVPPVNTVFFLSDSDLKTIEFAAKNDILVNTILGDLILHI